MNNEEIVALPVTGWELRTIPAMDALLITISFLATPMDRPEDAQARTFALHTTQAAELAQKISSALLHLGSGAPQGSGLPSH